VDYIQTGVIMVVVTKNLRMSKHWKAELVPYGIHKQPSPRITHLTLLKPDHSSVCLICPDSIQHLVLTSKSHNYQIVHRNSLYEFINGKLHVQSFCGDHDKISPNP
jgi:hypothetical protein